MQVDKNIFFREATLRICGNLRIEQALWDLFIYIKDHIPSFETHLHYYNPAGITRTIAMADSSGGRLLKLKTTYPPEVREYINSGRIGEEYIAGNTHDHPALKYVFKGHCKSRMSTLAMRLGVKKNWVGGITLNALGNNCFTKEHLDLFLLINKPITIALSNSLRYKELLEIKERLSDDNRFLQDELQSTLGKEIIGADFGLKGVMDLVQQVAPLKSPVLLLGETGTGKEVIARAVHNISPRRNSPFITVNCGAIPETLMDSELFGHEKGAFTGAISRKYGRFERANNSTILLDEIGELSLKIQVRLLRVLQEKEIERVGGTDPIALDIRVIAATHRNLEDMVRQGKFREDLYFRLQVFPVIIPPLRKRRGDIISLVNHFIVKKSREMKLPVPPVLPADEVDALLSYRWPGNVRELENAVERALILNRNKPLSFKKILFSDKLHNELPSLIKRSESMSLDEAMANYISTALNMSGGKVDGKNGAARLLEINPGTLRHRMRKLGIPFGKKRLKNTKIHEDKIL
jgi:transcriptional regulator with GAF, ATPase, and Fis domain